MDEGMEIRVPSDTVLRNSEFNGDRNGYDGVPFLDVPSIDVAFSFTVGDRFEGPRMSDEGSYQKIQGSEGAVYRFRKPSAGSFSMMADEIETITEDPHVRIINDILENPGSERHVLNPPASMEEDYREAARELIDYGYLRAWGSDDLLNAEFTFSGEERLPGTLNSRYGVRQFSARDALLQLSDDIPEGRFPEAGNGASTKERYVDRALEHDMVTGYITEKKTPYSQALASVINKSR